MTVPHISPYRRPYNGKEKNVYSRYKNATYDPRDEDGITEVCEDEYELYRYNLPPRYDGSRFRHRPRTTKESVAVDDEPTIPSCETCSSNAENESAQFAHTDNEVTAPWLSLPHLTSRGYEDLLIICLILLITEKGDSAYDVTLLLLLLLGAK